MIALHHFPRRSLRVLCFLAAACTCAPAPAQDSGLDPDAQRYELGQGLSLGDGSTRVGGYGYGKGRYADSPDSAQLSLDALSGFLWWDNGARWHFFSEVELSNAVAIGPGSDAD